MTDPLIQPWTVTLTASEHDLILFGLVATALTLLATLVRVRFSSGESQGTFRVASLTASAVVALALVSYLTLITTFTLGYIQQPDGTFHPNGIAKYAWELRYMDWVVTVPLLVIEFVAVSALASSTATWIRRIGMAAAITMIALGFLGAFVVDSGQNRVTYTFFGVGAAACFGLLYALLISTVRKSLPQLPQSAARPYKAAIVLLLTTWLLYPIAYGVSGLFASSTAVVIGQLALCVADMLAKIGFGTLVHRTSVLRSRHDDDLDPSTPARPRSPARDSMYVTDPRTLDFDN